MRMGCCRSSSSSSSSSSRYVSSKLWVVLQLWRRPRQQHPPQLGAKALARECTEIRARRCTCVSMHDLHHPWLAEAWIIIQHGDVAKQEGAGPLLHIYIRSRLNVLTCMEWNSEQPSSAPFRVLLLQGGEGVPPCHAAAAPSASTAQ
jgi:hypothetical protein